MKKNNSIEERNQDMQERGIADYGKAFMISFRDRKKVFFEVVYGDLVSPNQDAYFATQATELNYRRTDIDSGGQAQERLLKNKLLKEFFYKWDKKHLDSLLIEEYDELIFDIRKLKEKIPYIESTRFNNIVEFDREMSKK